MKRSSFFDSPKEWSRRKHRLLGKYLQPFSAKLGSSSPTVYCVDAFAGRAKYEEDGSPGSPLIMAQLSDKCAGWQNPVELKLINVESDPESFESLRQVTEPWVNRGIVKNIPGEFGDVVEDVLAEVGPTAPALFFIDPWGPTDIHFSYLQPILNRPQRKTELIINFDHDGLRRLTDQLHSKAKTSSGIKGAQTTVKRAAEIVGSDRWKSLFLSQELSSAEREQALLSEYLENLTQYGYTASPYAIRERFGKPIKYYLVFCTRHPDGLELTNDFIYEEEREMLTEYRSTRPILPYFEEVERTDRSRALKQLILDHLQSAKRTNRRQIRQTCIAQHHGIFHSKEYRSVVKELLDEGTLVKTRKGRINDDDLLIYVPKPKGLFDDDHTP